MVKTTNQPMIHGDLMGLVLVMNGDEWWWMVMNGDEWRWMVMSGNIMGISWE
jgi:hypothetical protein